MKTKNIFEELRAKTVQSVNIWICQAKNQLTFYPPQREGKLFCFEAWKKVSHTSQNH